MDYKNIKITRYPEQTPGGQQCGIRSTAIKAESEDGEIIIIVHKYRSQYQNRDLAITLMELATDKIKPK